MIPEQRQNECNPILFFSKYRSFNNVSPLNAVYPWITNSTDNDHKLINCLEEIDARFISREDCCYNDPDIQ